MDAKTGKHNKTIQNLQKGYGTRERNPNQHLLYKVVYVLFLGSNNLYLNTQLQREVSSPWVPEMDMEGSLGFCSDWGEVGIGEGLSCFFLF